jgi:hypothetical protein
MELGRCAWNGVSGIVGYGFQKLDQGTACIRSTASEATRTVFQAEPDHRFYNPFSPKVFEAIRWVENNPKAINLFVNLCMVANNIAKDDIRAETIAFLLQIFVSDRTNPALNRIMTLANAVNIGQVATNQLLGTRTYNMMSIFAHLQNICYNSYVIKKIHDRQAAKPKDQ